MMSRKVTLKELILIGLLIVIAAYYFGFHVPITKQMESIEAQQAEIDVQLAEAEVQVAQKQKMEKALIELENSGKTSNKMPEYNNIDRMLVEFNTIMSGTTDYSITFSDATAEDNIARRTLTIDFSVSDYDSVVKKIKKINSSKNRYLITNMTLYKGINNEIVMGNSDAFVSAQITVTSFEYVSPTGEQPPLTDEQIQAQKEAELAAIQEEE